MNVQDFSTQLLKADVSLNSTASGKNRIKDNQFQSFLENMGLFAAMQNPQAPMEQMTGLQEQTVLLDPAEMLGDEMTDSLDNSQLERFLFWNQQQSSEKGFLWAMQGEQLQQNRLAEQTQPEIKADGVGLSEMEMFAKAIIPAAQESPDVSQNVQDMQNVQGVQTAQTTETLLPSDKGIVREWGMLPKSSPDLENVKSAAGDKTEPPYSAADFPASEDGIQTAVEQQAISLSPRSEAKQSQQEKKVLVQDQAVVDAEGQTRTRTFQMTAKEENIVPRMAVHQEDFSETMGKTLSRAVQTGHQEFEIQLEPANLGRISIKVSTENHQTAVLLTCSQEKTMQLLANHAGEIGTIMENNLGTMPQIVVDHNASEYLEQEGSHAGQQNRERQQEQQQEQRDRESRPDDFLQKLRVGLIGKE